jgi:hypothetical protein
MVASAPQAQSVLFGEGGIVKGKLNIYSLDIRKDKVLT